MMPDLHPRWSFPHHNVHGVSAKDSGVILQGRHHGGCLILYRSTMGNKVRFIKTNSNKRMCSLCIDSADVICMAPNDTAYKRWSCHSGLKLLCKLCRTSPPQAIGARFTVFFGHAGHANPLDGWRCCSQKRVMSRPIQV